jgi:hypothetical protein
VVAGLFALLASIAAIALLLMLQSSEEDLRDTRRLLDQRSSQLGAAGTRIESLETRLSVAREQVRACERSESLSVRLWNKHVEEMNANLNSTRAEYERLYEEAQSLRKQANRARRTC